MRVPIKLTPIYQNVDPTGQKQGSTILYNGFVDEAEQLRPVPGLSTHLDLGTNAPVQTFWWSEKGYAIYVSAGRLFYQDAVGGAAVEVTLSACTISTTTRCTFVGTKHRLFLASGGQVITWLPGSAAVYVSAGTPPTNVTHLGFLDGYIVANQVETGTAEDSYYFATPSTVLVTNEPDWSAGDTAQGLPDGMTGLAIEWRDMLLFGKRSVELWYDAGTAAPASPFLRREGAFVQRGVLAPYSFVGANNTWYWLDSERKVVQLLGTEPKVLSSPFDRTFQGFTNATDAVGMVINLAGADWFVLTFPSIGRTFAYEYRLDQWAEWAVWSAATQLWSAWSGKSHSYAETWNKHLVGSALDNGLVYSMDSSTHQIGAASRRVLIQTAAIDHNTSARKRCDKLWMRIKSGQYPSSVESTLAVRWKNDNGNWSAYRTIDLGQTGQTENVYWLNNLGMYRSRQWEFVFSSNSDFALAALEEDVEMMGA